VCVATVACNVMITNSALVLLLGMQYVRYVVMKRVYVFLERERERERERYVVIVCIP
jgi:hypothetical protein